MQNDGFAEDCARALREYGVREVRRLGAAAEAQARWELVGPWGVKTFEVVQRTGVAAGAAAALAGAFPRGAKRRLLVTDRVGPELAQELRRLEVCYVDAGGNAWVTAPGLWIRAEGRPGRPVVHRPARLFRKAGMRLLYLLLHEPDMAALRQRDLARKAGIALGNIPGLLRDLREGGLLVQTGETEFELNDAAALRQRWEEAYLQVHRPNLHVAGYRLARGEVMDTWGRGTKLVGACGMGGELGAAWLAQQLRPLAATLYREAPMTKEELEKYRLVPTQDAPQVHVLRPIADQAARTRVAADGLRVADPLLLRVELLATKDPRCLEAAHDLLDRFLPDHLR